jgi:hypothetical protein
MYEAARAAVARLSGDASKADIEAAASLGIQPLVREFNHHQACLELVEGVRTQLQGANKAEWVTGVEAVAKALTELPIGVSLPRA